MNITGYRTNADHTETLAWEERTDGSVVCDHQTQTVCSDCIEADGRLSLIGDIVRVVHWPINAIRDGRTVRWAE